MSYFGKAMRGALAGRDGVVVAACGCERLLDLGLRRQWPAATARRRMLQIDEIYLYQLFDEFYNTIDGMEPWPTWCARWRAFDGPCRPWEPCCTKEFTTG